MAAAVASSSPSSLLSVNPSIIPLPVVSAPPASKVSVNPSLSESRSRKSCVPSPSKSSTGNGVACTVSCQPSLLTSTKPSIRPSPLLSVPPASIASVKPSLSESRSRKSTMPSLSVSTATFPIDAASLMSVLSASKMSKSPSPSASATPLLGTAASATEIMPSPFVSVSNCIEVAPFSCRSGMPSLSLSRSW